MILARISKGIVEISHVFKDELFKAEGKLVEIKVVGNTKSIQQLRYLWGVVFQIISDFTGFSPEEVADVYKRKLLSYHKENKGKIHKFTKGLSTLNQDEMRIFIDKVILHATTELGLAIPEADSL